MNHSLVLALLTTIPAAAVLADPSSCPIGVLSCSSGSSDANTCCVPKYGLLVHVQQWYQGLGPSDEYTMHGLWPDTCSGGQTGSHGCDSSRSYDNVGDIIQGFNGTLYSQMNTYWPSYNGDNGAFWSHEWTKHGTCVTTLAPRCYGSGYQQYEDVGDYFTKALQLRQTYGYYQALAKHGIFPDNNGQEFSADDFKSAIKQELGVEVALKCENSKLSEIWTWFHVQDKDTYVPTKQYESDTCHTFTYNPKY